MSEAEAAAKPCAVCGIDCTGRPRVKDQQGRYLCNDCYELAKQTIQVQNAPPLGPIAAPEPSPFDAPLPEPQPADMTVVLDDANDKPRESRCPECGRPLKSRHIVCVACGYDTETGKRLRMKVRRLRRSRELADELLDPAAARRALLLGCLGAIAGAAVGIAQWILLASVLERGRGFPILGLGVLLGVGASLGAGNGAGWRSSRTAALVYIPALVAGACIIAVIFQARAGAAADASLVQALRASFSAIDALWVVIGWVLAKEFGHMRPLLRRFPD